MVVAVIVLYSSYLLTAVVFRNCLQLFISNSLIFPGLQRGRWSIWFLIIYDLTTVGIDWAIMVEDALFPPYGSHFHPYTLTLSFDNGFWNKKGGNQTLHSNFCYLKHNHHHKTSYVFVIEQQGSGLCYNCHKFLCQQAIGSQQHLEERDKSQKGGRVITKMHVDRLQESIVMYLSINS